ncbi:MAG: DUF1512 domain-containing protein [Fervidicoccaceae archaeon]|uniref:DUF1512 domain-containing protein n=1 Tax=Fervidicoccus fontis TaxID=683846 RepID=A0A7C2YGV5_9CREN|nr:DUF1512 domain-containing protein [Fervidicoccus fontis]
MSSTITDWISAISQLAFLVIFMLLFLGFNQKFQIYISSRNIKLKLGILERMMNESQSKTVSYMRNLGLEKPEQVVEKGINYFTIEPVNIEPTDIIKRMDTLFSTREERLEGLIKDVLPNAGKVERSIASTALEISAALTFVYKYVRHLLIMGQKTNNWILIMQLEMVLPMIIKQAEAYSKALDVFLDGKPIGDGAGPLLVHRIVGPTASPTEIVKDTVYYEAQIENRKVYLIKASGPESNVGHPGFAVEELLKRLNERGEKVGMIVTVDAALKLEGENTGEVAEGAGAAIGDPGPEKIRIERAASAYGIPLHAVIVKMGMEEAILTMKKEISDAVEKAIENVKELVKRVPEGQSVIIAGIGNSVGIL